MRPWLCSQRTGGPRVPLGSCPPHLHSKADGKVACLDGCCGEGGCEERPERGSLPSTHLPALGHKQPALRLRPNPAPGTSPASASWVGEEGLTGGGGRLVPAGGTVG